MARNLLKTRFSKLVEMTSCLVANVQLIGMQSNKYSCRYTQLTTAFGSYWRYNGASRIIRSNLGWNHDFNNHGQEGKEGTVDDDCI
jgi:hypothetical protein